MTVCSCGEVAYILRVLTYKMQLMIPALRRVLKCVLLSLHVLNESVTLRKLLNLSLYKENIIKVLIWGALGSLNDIIHVKTIS